MRGRRYHSELSCVSFFHNEQAPSPLLLFGFVDIAFDVMVSQMTIVQHDCSDADQKQRRKWHWSLVQPPTLCVSDIRGLWAPHLIFVVYAIHRNFGKLIKFVEHLPICANQHCSFSHAVCHTPTYAVRISERVTHQRITHTPIAFWAEVCYVNFTHGDCYTSFKGLIWVHCNFFNTVLIFSHALFRLVSPPTVESPCCLCGSERGCNRLPVARKKERKGWRN